MSDKCPNCDKPVLNTDVICWHCGYQLPKRPPAKAESDRRSTDPSSRSQSPGDDAGAAEPDLRALAIYGLLTLAVIAALWFVISSLSRQPILVRNATFDRGGWVNITDVELRYTLSMPSDWQWLDVAYRDQLELLDEIVTRQPYIDQALSPLGEMAGDVELLGLAVGTQALETTDSYPFVIIGRSAQLGGLAPADALAQLNDAPGVSEQALDTRTAGQPQARFTMLDRPYAYQCRHLFTAVENIGYLLAACAPQSRYGTLQRDLAGILDSFQLVEN